MQLSYGSSTPSLSSTEKYPIFLRTTPSERSHASLEFQRLRVKAGSRSNARPCVALIRETQFFLAKTFSDFLAITRKDPTQRNARIGSESILVSRCVSTSVDAKATQRNALFSVAL